jgi:hypothetical protein
MHIPSGTRIYDTVVGHYSISYPNRDRSWLASVDIPATIWSSVRAHKEEDLKPVVVELFGNPVVVWVDKVINDVS